MYVNVSMMNAKIIYDVVAEKRNIRPFPKRENEKDIEIKIKISGPII